MGLEDNYRKWACDKCGATEHIVKADAREAAWGTFKRVDANGVITTRYFCPTCKQDYQAFVQAEDASFQTWLINTEGDDE